MWWQQWGSALVFALAVVALVTGLFYNWFAVRDRYEVFLYYHDMGQGFDTTPFGWVTVSRYWMSGLVASGAVLAAYSAIQAALGWMVQGYRPPKGWWVWLFCAVPLATLLPAIVMTVNDPTLPPNHTIQVVTATWIGLAVALFTGQMAAERPLEYALLLVDGGGLSCLLVALAAMERLPHWLARGSTGVLIGLAMALGAGVGLTVAVSAVRCWRRRQPPPATLWFVTGLQVTYLLLPLVHHVFFGTDEGSFVDPGYFAYMPDADNYFAQRTLFQVGVWAAVGAFVVIGTWARRWLEKRRHAR
jgi:hypothetical protein